MPTTRRRKVRAGGRDVPGWVQRYLATGEEPPANTPERDDFLNYHLLGVNTPGMPLLPTAPNYPRHYFYDLLRTKGTTNADK